MKQKNIEVMPYDDTWPMQFQKEANTIKSTLADMVVAIHHIGSTAIPGLAAKKDLDILLVVDQLKNSLLLQKIGYIFKGELNIFCDIIFQKIQTLKLICMWKSHMVLSLNLAFRDWLSARQDDKDSYQNLNIKFYNRKHYLKVRGMLSNHGREKDGFIKYYTKIRP